MSSSAPVFPAFIKLEHQTDGSTKSAFMREVDDMIDSAESRFKRFGDNTAKYLDNALSAGRTGSGGLDIGVTQMREAAAAAELRAKAAREIATATLAAARAEGDYSQQARLAIAAANAQAVAEEQAAQAARDRAAAAEQIQAALNRQVAANDNVTAALMRNTAAHGSARAANGQVQAGLQQLSYQLGDIATMWSMGARPMQIFASQSGQVAQAVGLMAAGSRGFASFLGGPWVIAITAGVTVLGTLAGALWAAEEAQKAVEFSSYKLNEAQGILGSVMDLTTGRINTQKDALLALAQAQLIAGQVQARSDMSDARKEMGGITKYRTLISGNFGGGLSRSKQRGREADIVESFMDGSMNMQEAVRGLNSLAKTGMITEDAMVKATKAVTDFGVAAENLKVFEAAEAGLRGDKGALGQFLKPEKSKKERSSRTEAQREIENQIRATRQFISVLEDEIAKIGLDDKALRSLEVTRQLSAARTQQEKDRIVELAAQRERLFAIQAQELAVRKASSETDKIRSQVSAAEREAQVLELVGWERDKAILRMEREDAIRQKVIGSAIAEAAGNAQLAEELRRQIPLLEQIYGLKIQTGNRADQIEQERAATERLNGQLQEMLGLLQGIGGTAGTLGGVLGGIMSGNFAGLGPLGGLANILLRHNDYDAQAQKIAKRISEVFDVKGPFADTLGKALQGAGVGAMAGNAVLGSSGSNLGSSIGGALGQAAGTKLLSSLGSFAGPAGAIVGGILGGLVGGLFKTSRTARANITGVNSISVGGADSGNYGTANQLAGSVITGLQKIADELGASIGSFNTTIGVRGDDFRVNTSGTSLKKKKGAVDFDDDSAAAIKYAIADAIKDGALLGLKASTQALLQMGDDIEAQIQKALDFEGVFTALKKYKDPVGAAIDELNSEFEKLISIFGEAGASAQEWAQLEELYGIKRAEAIKAATEAMVSSLQDLYDFLSYGDSGLSLRDRQTELRSRYAGLKSRVEAGDTSAFDEYSKVGRELLDVERQLYGSTQAYFDLHEEVRATTKATLDRQTALANAAANSDNPFSASTVPTTDNASVVTAIDNLSTAVATNLGYKLDAVNLNLGNVTQRLSTLITLQQQYPATGGTW